MAKKRLYYMILDENNNIISIGTTYDLYEEMVEIARTECNHYKSIIESIPDKDGYTKKVTLHTDGSYEVEYIPQVIIEDEIEE